MSVAHVDYDTFVWPRSAEHPTGEDWMSQIIGWLDDVKAYDGQHVPPLYGPPTFGHWVWRALVEGWALVDIKHGIYGEPLEWGGPGGWERQHAPPPPSLVTLHASKQILRTADGTPFRYAGVTAFRLMDRFRQGADIDPFLEDYKGFNTVRVFPYVPVADWGASAWDVPETEVILSFLSTLLSKGWRCMFTLLTDDSPARLAWAQRLVPVLAAAKFPHLFLEAGNEPETHKNINTAALRDALNMSGYLYSSGNYENSNHFFGRVGTAHTPRDAEWPRKAHDLLEYYNGEGPNAPSDPAHPVPWLADEPAKYGDTGVGGDPDDWRAYFGTAAILGAGATFHSATGKQAVRPTTKEKQLASAALEGLTAFPADAPLLPYSRPVENSLRTYVVGNKYMVRVRPTTDDPGGGWTRVGSSAILWKK